jgi:hypothetical protein
MTCSSSPPQSTWQPYREPLVATLVRTVAIAVVAGAALARRAGGFARWPAAALLVLWISLGGHFVELGFLNVIRPRLAVDRAVQVAVRLLVWFAGGAALFIAMRLTATVIGGLRAPRWPAWWIGGLAFIGIELVAHLVLSLTGRPNFYNGRG